MLKAQIAVRLGTLRLDVTIAAAPGEIVAVLGPNGAGKSTFLRAVAGLVPLDRGRVELDAVVLEDVARRIHLPPERRPIGVVFQDYLLFPHLSALENVAFGLRARGVGASEARARAGSWLDRLGLSEHANTKPRTLSGGQAQRVALARALAIDPRLLLLDEPLAALDASARGEVRRDLKRHLASFAGIRILITHDPLEAVALADRLVILERGHVVQTGSPVEVTRRPRSRYVADLVGVNLLRGVATAGHVALPGGASLQSADAADGEVFAVIHPRAVALHRARPEGSPRNVWRGRASTLDFQGDRVRVGVEGAMPISATSAKPAQKLMSADDALARILAGVPTLPAVESPLLDALGLVLAEDVAADRDVPPFRNSAMDGYAVRGEDVASAPAELRVVGEVAAGGFPDRTVGPGEAMRIMTGAPVRSASSPRSAGHGFGCASVRASRCSRPGTRSWIWTRRSGGGRSETPTATRSRPRSARPVRSRGCAASSAIRPMRCERPSARQR